MWENILASSIVMIAFILIMACLYAVMSMRKVKGRKSHYEHIHQELKVGQKVVFLNGLYGSLSRVGQETVDIKIKSGAVMEVSRYAISQIVE